MPGPSATWNSKRVFITYRNVLTGQLEPGTWNAKSDVRITNTLSDQTHQVFRAGLLKSGNLNTNEGNPSLSVDLPIVDDPDNTPNGGVITLTITFEGGTSETFKLSPLLSWPEEGTDLALILDPTLVSAAPPFIMKGVAGGVAALDSEGFVLDAAGNRISGGTGTGTGTGGDVNWGNILQKPAFIAAGSSAALARTVIAVPSTTEVNQLLTGKADLVNGLLPIAQVPSITSAKISDFTEAAQDAIASLLAGGTNVTLAYNDATNSLVINSSGGAGGTTTYDPEQVRDTVGFALVGTGYISVVANDAADTITVTGSQALIDALNSKAPTNNPAFTGNVSGISKAMVGLDQADNTPDLEKPLSNPVADILGSIDALTTADTSSLVAAINEIASRSGNAAPSLATMPAGYTHTIDLPTAKSLTSRSQVTDRTDIFLRIVGGNSDVEWQNPWYTRGFDVWDWFPGVVRRGAVCKVSTANSATFFPTTVIPASTVNGDKGILFLNRGSSTSGTAPTISGWTYVATYTANTTGITDVYTKDMVDSDANVSLALPFAGTSQRLASSLVVYGGVSALVPIVGRPETTAGLTHATPTITAPAAGVIWSTFIANRNSTPDKSFTPPPGTAIAAADYGPDAGGSWSVAIADSLPNYLPAGTVGGGNWTGTVSSSTVDTISFGLVPTSA